ncbi:hypothetical protein GCM10022247_14170 [Allokutzneria multivorans]|uniref:Secreted protein n=1 Tax=Allokutzneria multivorans TaxID=1142134 RepID=A0ABP7RCJ9_9PSEU
MVALCVPVTVSLGLGCLQDHQTPLLIIANRRKPSGLAGFAVVEDGWGGGWVVLKTCKPGDLQDRASRRSNEKARHPTEPSPPDETTLGGGPGAKPPGRGLGVAPPE